MPNDDIISENVIAAIRDFRVQLDALSASLNEAFRIHRDIVFRSINLLNHEVVDFKDRLDKDDEARARRQAQIDAKLETITAGQQQIKRWQWIRLGVELLAIAVVAAYLYGSAH